MEIPIELFILGIVVPIALALFGFLRNPQIPAMLAFGGMFILFISISTTEISLGQLETENTSDVFTKETWYNVTSHSTGARVSDGPSPFISRVVFVDSGSFLIGKLIDCISIPIQPVGSPPVGTLIEVGTFNGTANIIKEFGTKNVTSLNSSVVTYDFCLPEGDAYLINQSDRIGIKYSDGDSSNFIQIRIDANDPYDSNTYMQSYTTSWVNTLSTDITAEFTFSLDRTITTLEYTPNNFEFTELPKTFFALLGAIFMLSGALMIFKEVN